MCFQNKTTNRWAPSKHRLSFLTETGFGHDHRRKSTLQFLAVLFLYLSLVPATFGSPQRAAINDTQPATSSIVGNVNVATGQGQVNNLADVTVKLSDSRTQSTLQSTLTDETGHFKFTQLAAGTYTLEAAAEGFRPLVKAISVEQGQALVEDLTLEISVVDERIEVRAEAFDVSTRSAEAAATITDRELDTLPLAVRKFTEALPLTPGVVRTPSGKLNFNGQSENQGILVLNSTEAVDPVTGSFAIPVPVDVIQSMTVHSTPDNAEYGGFSGGLTLVETKPPFDAWSIKVHDFIPSLRGENGHLIGIGQFTPRLVFGGPLIRGKLNFTQELTYEVRKQAVRGLSWPFNETKTTSVISFTQLQVILSPHHLFDVNINVFPLRREFADINSLVPQTASSNYGQNGVSVGISDSYQLSSGALLNTVLRYTRFDSHAHGQGPEDMLVTPNGWGGNFFNSWSRNGNELEFRPAFQFANFSWNGRHQLKIGLDVSRRSFTGFSNSRPIQVLRQDSSVAEQTSFQGAGILSGASTEAGEFVEDHWILDPHVAIDMGARLPSQSIGRRAGFGPHIGIAYSPTHSGKTVIRASAGTVYGHVPLLAADFMDNPTRVLNFFDPSGNNIGGPIVLQNVYLDPESGSAPHFSSQIPRATPRTFTWSFEVEREIVRTVSLRLSYLDAQTRNLFVVDSSISLTGGTSVLALVDNGAARYHRVEGAVHAKPFERGELNVAYVWSRSRGDLNTLSDTYMPFEQPVIRPNVSGVVSSDVPHRLLTWGVFELPWKLTVSPVLDVHTGLPYSNVDVLQNYAGVPDGQRFPTFVSLDAKVYREFSLPLPFLRSSAKRKLRLGVYALNLTNHQNWHDVYSNVESPRFGTFAGNFHRVDGFVIDII